MIWAVAFAFLLTLAITQRDDLALAAACGAIIVVGVMRDARPKPRPPQESERRRALASKIGLHVSLGVTGDCWSLTHDDMRLIVDALKEPAAP